MPSTLISYRFCRQKCVPDFPLCAESIEVPLSIALHELYTNPSSENADKHPSTSVHTPLHVNVTDCITLRKLIRWLTAVTLRVSQRHSDFTLKQITVRYGLGTLPHVEPRVARPVTTLITTRTVTWARLLSDNCGSNATNLHQFFLHIYFRAPSPPPGTRCSRYPPNIKHSARVNLLITVLLDELASSCCHFNSCIMTQSLNCRIPTAEIRVWARNSQYGSCIIKF